MTLRRYKCQSCELLFASDEVPELFSTKTHLCARCHWLQQNDLRRVRLPECFGLSYDGMELLCTRRCLVTKGCLIQFIDQKAVGWSLDIDARYNRRKKATLQQHAVYILRALGRPIHVQDLAPLIYKVTGGKFAFGGETHWRQRLSDLLQRCSDVAHLGDNFFVWVALWEPGRDSGMVGYSQKKRRVALTPVEQIFEVEEQEEV